MGELSATEQRYEAVGKVAQSVAKDGCLHSHYPTDEGACHKPWPPCETAFPQPGSACETTEVRLRLTTGVH
jgi:hypothetical protein